MITIVIDSIIVLVVLELQKAAYLRVSLGPWPGHFDPWSPGQVVFQLPHLDSPPQGANNAGHRPAGGFKQCLALSTGGRSQLPIGARRPRRACDAAAEPRDPRPLRARGGLRTPVQRAWGLWNPTQSPDSASFLTYIVPVGSRAISNMRKIQ